MMPVMPDARISAKSRCHSSGVFVSEGRIHTKCFRAFVWPRRAAPTSGIIVTPASAFRKSRLVMSWLALDLHGGCALQRDRHDASLRIEPEVAAGQRLIVAPHGPHAIDAVHL